ncbi:M56 family metallopeptidase [Hymenobacter fodinae]|uniref:Peptidase M56 domain-containing protein n=1 Tax=Hymenobacter fodinae TaxID=2510796 RepID=A0A4Z0PCD9_9BACT|nr:M56 family metallopeptidase [Hymenobacter fodinae]TGE10316.1 hypothetical protein EU556_05730 [Hymenobacter fodinae]
MNWLEQLLPPALIRALGWTLVHSLWQGAVVALALAGLLLLLQRHRAVVRYNTAAAALVALLVLAGITFGRYYTAARAEHQTAAVAVTTDAAMPDAPTASAEQPAAATVAPATTAVTAEAAVASEVAPAPAGLQAWLTYFDQNLPVLVAAWLLGLLAMTLRLLGGLAYVQRLRRYRVQPLGQEWQERLSALASRAGLHQPIELLESALVRVPVVVGHLRPVVLLPLGTVTGLSQTYLEAILAHELAHVARRDYLVNLLQSVAETLFFYHPAVWFLTACLRTERENCCDDMATAMVGGNPLTVARALAALAELSAVPATPAQLALSALGPDGSVLGRIKRLVQGRTAPTFSEGFMAACVVLGGMVLLTSAVAMADPRPNSPDDKEGGALSKLPFLQAAPNTNLVAHKELLDAEDAEEAEDAVEILDEAAAAPALQDDDDDDKGKKHRKRNKQVVVVQEGARRPGTVVIEKDKKGRLTDLYVDGRRVETASVDKKSKKNKQDVEVISVGPNGRVWSSATPGSDFRFNDNFSRVFTVPRGGISEADLSRIRRQAEAGAQLWRVNPELKALTFNIDRSELERTTRRALAQAEQNLREAQGNATSEEEMERLEKALDKLRDQREEMEDRLREGSGAHRQFEELKGLNGNFRVLSGNVLRLEDSEATRRMADAARRESELARRESDKARREGDVARRISELDRRRDLAYKQKNQKEATRLGQEITALERQLATAHRETEAAHRETEAAHRETERVERETTLRGSARVGTSFRTSSGGDEALRRELLKDGLIEDDGNFQFKLNSTELIVNGKKQPAAVHAKYLKLVETQTGNKLTKGSYNITRNTSSNSSTSYGDAPAPPRPPRAPRAMTPPVPPVPPVPAAPAAPSAPAAPGVPGAPGVPAPPAPPRLDSDEIRAELRKDGLLGANEKAFQFQLNDQGLTVNGKKQSEALTNKYRQMLDVPATKDSKGSKTSRNIQINVSE